MKTTKSEQENQRGIKDRSSHTSGNQQGLKTDRPLSERDEVKQAESRTNKPLRQHL